MKLLSFPYALFSVLAGLATGAAAQPRPAPPAPVGQFEYAAKFVCGLQKNPASLRLTRGLYGTTVNIHNPNDAAVRFRKKLALTFPPEEQQGGEVLPIGEDSLKPDQALKVDCDEVRRKFFAQGFPAQYIEGFVVIESRQSLDVTAVYTSASLDRAGTLITQSGVDVEQIRERRKQARAGEGTSPDLIPDSYCMFRVTPAPFIRVFIKNQGTGPAGASFMSVNFGARGIIYRPVPALAAGALTSVDIEIPPGCFDPDCEFIVTVDVYGDVTESDESNNSGKPKVGVCIG